MRKCRGSLLFGPEFGRPFDQRPVLRSMCEGVRRVWVDDSFLLFRLFRIALALVQFVNPHNWVCVGTEAIACRICGKDAAYRAIYWVTDVYILAKLVVPLCLLHQSWITQTWVYWLSFGLVLETVGYVLGNVFVPGKLASYLRSSVMLLLGYFAVTVSFACMYLGRGQIKGVLSPADAIYFSFVTSSTLGYGDMKPITALGQRLVVFQIITSALFVVSFFPVFFSRLSSRKPARNE